MANFIDPDEVTTTSSGFIDPDSFVAPKEESKKKPTHDELTKYLQEPSTHLIGTDETANKESAGGRLGKNIKDVGDLVASTPAFLVGGAAALANLTTDIVNPWGNKTPFRHAMNTFNKALEVGGNPISQIETAMKNPPKAGEFVPPEEPSLVQEGMEKVGSGIKYLADKATEATGSDESGAAVELLLNLGGPKIAHEGFTAAKGLIKAANDTPIHIVEDVDPTAYVDAWKESVAKEPAGIKETAFRHKDTGEVIATGLRHDEDMKSHPDYEQGFVLDNGEFVNRQEAADVAQTVHGDKLVSKPSPTNGLHTDDFGPTRLEALKISDLALESDNPHPATIKDIQSMNTEGVRILKEQGPEAAESWAKEVLAYRRNQPMAETPTTSNALSDFFYRIGKNEEADKVEMSQHLLKSLEEDVDLPMKEHWREYAESGKDLDVREMALYNKYYSPLLKEIAALLELAQKEGFILPLELDSHVAGANVPRMTIPNKVGFWDKAKERLTDPGKGGFAQELTEKPGGVLERGLFAAEDAQGNRVIVQAKDNRIVTWRKATATEKLLEAERQANIIKGYEASLKKTGLSKELIRDLKTQIAKAKERMVSDYVAKKFGDKETSLKAGDKVGDYTIKEAGVSELEANTPYRYNKDSLVVAATRLQELRDFVRAKQQVKQLMESPLFEKIGVKIEQGKSIPDGWKQPEYIDKIPEFAGIAFEPTARAIIEDFARNWTPNYLTLISGTLIKNMMLNPLSHIMNEVWHVYNARGLSGWVSPVGIARFVKSGIPAIKEVLHQGPQYRSMLRDGASLLSPEVTSNPIQKMLLDKGMKEFVDGPEGQSLAAKIGLSPLKLYDAISKKAGIAMWVTRDIMYMQLIKEKMMQGMDQKSAIHEVERHMPNYRLPPSILKSRQLSKVLQNPSITVFSRYHYGMLKSLGETAYDLSGKNGIKGFVHGADTAAAIVVALAVLYPLSDMLAQAMTNNNKATVRRAGPYHPIQALEEISSGEKDTQAFLASFFTFNPALLGLAQIGFNRKLYNGQPVFNPQDSLNTKATDIGKYIIGQVPQVGTGMKVADSEKGGGWSEFLAKQLDIKSPSKAAAAQAEKFKHRAKQAAINKEKKRGH